MFHTCFDLGFFRPLAEVDYVTVVSGIGGSYATLTFAPDAAVGIESATVLIERVCG